MKKKYYMRMTAAVLLMVLGLLFALSVNASASSPINTNIDAFDNFDGEAAYIKYFNNYSLDIEIAEPMDYVFGSAGMNTTTNVIFTVEKVLSYATVSIFYFSMTFDIVDMFHDQIGEMQNALNEGVFKELWLLGFCGCAFIMVKKLLKRDMIGAYGQIFKVIGLMILSILVVQKSTMVLSTATNLTKSVAAQALLGIQGENVNNVEDFALMSSEQLWKSLIHQPWIYFEFGNETVDDEFLEEFLSKRPSERLALIEAYEGEAFSVDRIPARMGNLLVYIFPLLFKCGIYIVLSLLTLFYQLLAIFYVILAPVVLILIMLPTYEGLLTPWLRKLFETQLSILLTFFITGLLVKFDTMLYTACAGAWGWLVVTIVQIIVEVLVVIKRDELLGILGKLSNQSGSGSAASGVVNYGIDKVHSLTERNIISERRQASRIADRIAAQANVDRVEHVRGGGKLQATGTEGRKAVERPVLNTYKQKQQAQRETTARKPNAKRQNVSVSAQNPQKAIERPRMDKNTNVVQFEAYKANKSGDIHRDDEQGETQVERPRMSSEQANVKRSDVRPSAEKLVVKKTPEVSQHHVQSNQERYHKPVHNSTEFPKTHRTEVERPTMAAKTEKVHIKTESDQTIKERTTQATHKNVEVSTAASERNVTSNQEVAQRHVEQHQGRKYAAEHIFGEGSKTRHVDVERPSMVATAPMKMHVEEEQKIITNAKPTQGISKNARTIPATSGRNVASRIVSERKDEGDRRVNVQRPQSSVPPREIIEK